MKNEKASSPFWIGIVFIFLIFQMFYFQYHQNKTLRDLVEFNNKSQKIDQDQIRDLLFQLQEEKDKNNTIAATNYVAGVVDSINRKDYYQEVWHEGFDTGMKNKILIEEAEKASFIASQSKEDKK